MEMIKMCEGQHMMHGMGRMHRNHGMHCFRQFLTKEEQVEMLKHYKEWLEKEAKGVGEQIEKLEKAS
jgi:hypothetical protein